MHSAWARDVCRFVLNTGLRQNDVMRLTPFQVDLAERVIRLTQGKTKRRITVALNDEACEILSRRMRLKPQLIFASPRTGTDGGTVRNAMSRACKRAGIPPLTIRDLRRTFATRALESGNDSFTVADALGHSSLRMIPRYVRSLDNKRRLVDSLNEKDKKIKKVGNIK
jgi:integrase